MLSRLIIFGIACVATFSARAAPAPDENFGPYNMTFLAGGIGMSRPLAPASPVLAAGAPWSLSGWIRVDVDQTGRSVVAAVGDPAHACRCLVLDSGRPGLALGDAIVAGDTAMSVKEWHAIAASYDGHAAHLYLDGKEIAARPAASPASAPTLTLAPTGGAGHFGGSVAEFTLKAGALTQGEVAALARAKPDFDLVTFTRWGVGWPWQVKAWRGLLAPQDAWTLPHAKATPGAPLAKPLPETVPLRLAGDETWTVGAWRLAEAPKVAALPDQLSRSGFKDEAWYPATVPGTVLTTLVDRGVYPDPYVGLNNMVIPERLARQDYWYRTEFETPAALDSRHGTLTFKGINYAAEVWLNGERLGSITGAFIRGVFDVTGRLVPGRRNALAVRISPPPHPGIPHEESIAAGPGENGGNLAIDGPTFVATEGWDWIPGIRDRDAGIWQDVVLSGSGPVRLLDPNVVTRLPLPRRDEASVEITVPVEAASATEATVEAKFEGVDVSKTVAVPAGRSEIRLTPAEFPALDIRNPRLWWPNGY
ncbi:MAG TPA: LamG-like jellyroll fold domain-containing protein, partial [Stellaceae bacterium]|nr:LamG-like jellyroll fold domain-containing protein [Stellaceae bacterium]